MRLDGTKFNAQTGEQNGSYLADAVPAINNQRGRRSYFIWKVCWTTAMFFQNRPPSRICVASAAIADGRGRLRISGRSLLAVALRAGAKLRIEAFPLLTLHGPGPVSDLTPAYRTLTNAVE